MRTRSQLTADSQSSDSCEDSDKEKDLSPTAQLGTKGVVVLFVFALLLQFHRMTSTWRVVGGSSLAQTGGDVASLLFGKETPVVPWPVDRCPVGLCVATNNNNCDLLDEAWQCTVTSCDSIPQNNQCLHTDHNDRFFLYPPARLPTLVVGQVSALSQGSRVITSTIENLPDLYKSESHSFRFINPAIAPLPPKEDFDTTRQFRIFARLTNYIGCNGHSAGPCLKGTTEFTSIIVSGIVSTGEDGVLRGELALSDAVALRIPDGVGAKIRDDGLEWWCENYPHSIPFSIEGVEDPRVVELPESGGRFVVFFNARLNGFITRMFFGVVDPTGSVVERVTMLTIKDRPLTKKEKNWIPFVAQGKLFLEYAIEPRLVMSVDINSGECTPLPPASAPHTLLLSRIHGHLRGSAPSIYLPNERLFLGLAHIKRKVRAGNLSHVYMHVFYLFRDEIPFSVLSVSRPFVFPGGSRRMDESTDWFIQFATGMVLQGDLLVVAFGEQDCDAKFVTVPLSLTVSLAREIDVNTKNLRNNHEQSESYDVTKMTYAQLARMEPGTEKGNTEIVIERGHPVLESRGWEQWLENELTQTFDGWEGVREVWCQSLCSLDDDCSGVLFVQDQQCQFLNIARNELFCNAVSTQEKTVLMIKHQKFQPLTQAVCQE